MLTLKITLTDYVLHELEQAYNEKEFTDLDVYLNDVLYDALSHRGK